MIQETAEKRTSSDERFTVSTQDVADYLGVSAMTVRRWCTAGDLPAMKAGRQWRIREDWKQHIPTS